MKVSKTYYIMMEGSENAIDAFGELLNELYAEMQYAVEEMDREQ